MCLCIIFPIVFILTNVKNAQSLTHLEAYDYPTCFVNYSNQFEKNKNAVGIIWSSRSLDIYQNNVNFYFLPIPGSYKWISKIPNNTKFNYLVIGTTETDSANQIALYKTIDKPTKVYKCPYYTINYYKDNTAGFNKLNELAHG
jgi:hypothetical protein